MYIYIHIHISIHPDFMQSPANPTNNYMTMNLRSTIPLTRRCVYRTSPCENAPTHVHGSIKKLYKP